MLDHKWLINPIKLVIQKYKNEYLALATIPYDGADNTAEIDEYHHKWNKEMPGSLI